MATKPKKPQVKKKPATQSPKAKAKIASADSAASLFLKLASPSTPEPHTEQAVSGLEEEVAAIYHQATEHRDKLVTFFIAYTWVFSAFVALIIVSQALARAFLPGKENIELIPYWALNLLVVGLIGQFVALLAIVTRKVWHFVDFFNYADSRKKKPNDKASKDSDKDNSN